MVRLHDTFDCKSRFYMVMELVSGGELLEHLIECGAYSEHDAAMNFGKVMDAVLCFHNMGIAHRDLKPENLLLAGKGDSNSIKIADFGFAKKMAKGSMLQVRGC